MKKGLGNLLVVLIVIAAIVGTCYFVYRVLNSKPEKPAVEVMKELETQTGEFKLYSVESTYTESENINLIMHGNYVENEMKAAEGDFFTMNTGVSIHEFTVKEVTADHITLAIEGLAPEKVDGTFSLLDTYDTITIKKNTGVRLFEQATDVTGDTGIYLYYV